MIRLAILLILASALHAREVRIAWDANPAVEQVLGYRLYVDKTLTAATSNITWNLTLSNAEASVTLTAFNAFGESLPAGPLVVPAFIPPVVCVLERSKDLLTWTMLQTIIAQNRSRLRVEITASSGADPLIQIEQTNDDGLVWVLITTVPYDPPEFFRIRY